MQLNPVFLISLSASVLFLILAVLRRSRLAGACFCFTAFAAILTFAFRNQLSETPLPDPLANQPSAEPPDVSDLQLVDFRPIADPDEGYVTSDACRKCHPEQHSSWSESYHRTMTQVARPDAVIGDFSDRSVTVDGRTYLFRQKGGQFWVNMDNPDAETPSEDPRSWCPIALTTGSHHMQIYWYPAGQARLLSQVPLLYLVEEQRWAPRRSCFLVPPGDPVSSEAGRWNETCIACHTTRSRPRIFDAAQVDSRVTEFGIACEACHGPGEQHVRLHELDDSADEDSKTDSDNIVNPANLSHELSSQVCAQCHSVTNSLSPRHTREYMVHGDRFRPGEPLGESLRIIRRDQQTRQYLQQFNEYRDNDAAIERYFDMTFWPDGMVRVSGREYSGLLESACHRQGEISCLSCHRLHKSEDDDRSLQEWANDQLKTGMRSDQACTQCHTQSQYASASHTHHAADSSGSRCYNCHMPHTTYGLLKAIRSHQIDSPDVTTSVKTGRPNACNLCHLDQTLQWSAQHLSEWYGTDRPELDEDQQTVSSAVLWALSGDAGQRALIAWHMGWTPALEASGSDWIAPCLIELLEDPYDAVRFIAAGSLRKRPGFENIEYDFVSSADKRRRAAEQAWTIWEAEGESREPNRASVLIDSSGNLQQETFHRLKDLRDDRDVRLQE